MTVNKTSEVEQRLRALFLFLRPALNEAATNSGLERPVDEAGIVYHVGNTPAQLKQARSPNVKAGEGFLILWPDSPGIDTKRTCATCWVAPGIQDYTNAGQVILHSMLADLIYHNGSEDENPQAANDAGIKVGLTKAGKASKALAKCIADHVDSEELGPWPLPGISKTVKVDKDTQGRRHEVRGYCSGLLNPSKSGKPQPCKVENTRAKPSKWYRGFHPGTWEDEIPDATCYLCKGPVVVSEELEATRKDRVDTVEIEIPA